MPEAFEAFEAYERDEATQTLEALQIRLPVPGQSDQDPLGLFSENGMGMLGVNAQLSPST